jgi:hypothetical protein
MYVDVHSLYIYYIYIHTYIYIYIEIIYVILFADTHTHIYIYTNNYVIHRSNFRLNMHDIVARTAIDCTMSPGKSTLATGRKWWWMQA